MRLSPELRLQIAERARGRCEYWLLHETDAAFTHQVDHILSRKHGGGSSADNLAYACTICTRLKGSDIASIDRSGRLVRLFNPRSADWTQHFDLDGAVIQPLTTATEATARLLRFNAAERVTERHLLQQLGRYPRA